MGVTYIIGPRVIWGKKKNIGDFVVIGIDLPKHKCIIGDEAIIRSHTIIYGGNKIGNSFMTGHQVLIREDNKIGNNVSIGSQSVIEHDITIGDRVRIHSHCFVPEYSVLEDDSWLGPHVVLTNAKYPRSLGVKKSLKGPIIKKFAKIGAHATILPGISIGAHSLIGAGTVVVEDVPDYSIVVGNPGKIINSVKNISAYV